MFNGIVIRVRFTDCATRRADQIGAWDEERSGGSARPVPAVGEVGGTTYQTIQRRLEITAEAEA